MKLLLHQSQNIKVTTQTLGPAQVLNLANWRFNTNFPTEAVITLVDSKPTLLLMCTEN